MVWKGGVLKPSILCLLLELVSKYVMEESVGPSFEPPLSWVKLAVMSLSPFSELSEAHRDVSVPFV